MKITGTQQSLQALKAQQAWEARRSSLPQAVSKISQPTADLAMASKVTLQSVQPASQTGAASTIKSQPATQKDKIALPFNIEELQDIATRSGFVGVTAQDIQRAYASGTSLLTDYRV
jgi:hypothetical protein